MKRKTLKKVLNEFYEFGYDVPVNIYRNGIEVDEDERKMNWTVKEIKRESDPYIAGTVYGIYC